MEENGFILVSHKRRLKKKRLVGQFGLSGELDQDLEASVKVIEQLKDVIKSEPKTKEFLSHFEDTDLLCKYDSIVAYGLGHLSSCRDSRTQFALLLLLRDFLNVSVEAYDPVFSLTDLQVLKFFQIEVIKSDERCMRKVVDKRVIFYMPHCDLPLYNNLLYSNWSPLKLLLISIVGNSFSNIVLYSLRRKSSNCINKEDFKYVEMVEQFCKEWKLPSNFFSEALNDTVVTTFPEDHLPAIDDDIWKVLEVPTFLKDVH